VNSCLCSWHGTTHRAWDYGVQCFLNLVEAPGDYPVTLAYVSDQHLRITNGTAEDDRITRAIAAATSQAEHYMQRALEPQTLELVLDRFPSAHIEIPRPPLIAVASVTYIDGNGDEQTLDADSYRVIRSYGPKARRSILELVSGSSWPVTQTRRDAVTVTYRAGYVEVPDASPEVVNVPEDIKEAIAMRAAEFYKQRSDSVVGVGVSVAKAVLTSRHIFADYKVY
jgi:uncharacterized phiE125 gp8 family phage protein